MQLLIYRSHGGKLSDEEIKKTINDAAKDYHDNDLFFEGQELEQLCTEYSIYRAARTNCLKGNMIMECKNSLLFSTIEIPREDLYTTAANLQFVLYAQQQGIIQVPTMDPTNKDTVKLLIAPNDKETMDKATEKLWEIRKFLKDTDVKTLSRKEKEVAEANTSASIPASTVHFIDFSKSIEIGFMAFQAKNNTTKKKENQTKEEGLNDLINRLKPTRTKSQRIGDAITAAVSNSNRWGDLLFAMVDGWGKETAVSDNDGVMLDNEGNPVTKQQLGKLKLEKMDYNGMQDANLEDMQLSVLLDELVSRERFRQKRDYFKKHGLIEKEVREYYDKAHGLFDLRATLIAQIASDLAENKLTQEQADRSLQAVEQSMEQRQIPEQDYIVDAAYWKRQDIMDQLVLRIARDFGQDATQEVSNDYVNTYFNGDGSKHEQLKNIIVDYPNQNPDLVRQFLVEMAGNAKMFKSLNARRNQQQSHTNARA